MKTYEEVLKTVEFALVKGEYNFCIEYLSPIIEQYSLESKEGVILRTIMITAFCGVNRKDDAKKICKELLKSYDFKTRESAKYLMEIVDSPEIKKPTNWNIKFESNPYTKRNSLNKLKPIKKNEGEKKYINLIDKPTGETKPFQTGFTFFLALILFLLIILLSGCVKIENTLNLSELESINNNFKIESKYINKFPWQAKFEKTIQNALPLGEIKIAKSNFSLENKNLNIAKSNEILKKITNIAGELAGGSTNFEMSSSEKNFIFFKKYLYKINVDLHNLPDVDDLEINFKIINPNKSFIISEKNSHLEISNNLIVWKLFPEEINILEFSFLYWNKLFIAMLFILLLVGIAYIIRFYRFKLGSDLPQLPQNYS